MENLDHLDRELMGQPGWPDPLENLKETNDKTLLKTIAHKI